MQTESDFHADKADKSPLRDFVAMLRQRYVIIVIAVVLVPAMALSLTLRQPKQYTATAELLFRDPEFDQKLFGGSVLGPSRDPNREASTNTKLVSLDVISARAAKALPDLGLTAMQVHDKIKVAPQGQADLISVMATDERPAVARRLANTIAEQYIAFRRDADRTKIVEAIDLVQERLSELSAEERAGSEGESVRQRTSQLQILASLQTGNAELVQPAQLPLTPSAPNPLRATILGLFAGLALGIGLAMLMHQLDRRMRHGSDAESIFGRPVLGVIPESRTLQSRGASLDLSGPDSEAFRSIRTNLRYFVIDRKVHSLLITSSAPGDGKSTVARYLAATAATSGTRVLLLEADLRRPTLRTMFPKLHGQGLTDVLTGQATLEQSIQRLPISSAAGSDPALGLDVLVSGAIPPNPTDLLESGRMNEVLKALESRYELVIVDTSPITVVPDAIALLELVSGVAVLTRTDKSTKNDVRHLHKLLNNLGITPLGIIVNGAPARGGAYYGYYGYSAAGPTASPNGAGTPLTRPPHVGTE